jgi:cell division protein FtsI/penicillin-binding protein 2
MRATFLGVIKSGSLSAFAANQHEVGFSTPAPRGAIISADGRELATDRPTVLVSATPFLITDPADAARRLAPIIHRDPNQLEEQLDSDDGYALLARSVTPAEAKRAKALDIAGVDFTDTYERYLPRGPMASQVVGLTNSDRVGISGIEERYDGPLTGTPGHRLEARDPFKRTLQVLKSDEAQPGHTVQLTLNSVIQAKVEQVLIDTRRESGAKSAMAVVMRPKDGAILAMANVPRFDPTNRRTFNADLARNRVVTDPFEPGSTFKIVTVAGALEEGLVKPNTRFYLPSELKTYDRTLTDAHERPPITASVTQILQQSSNIGTTLIAQRLGKDRLLDWIDRFGFLKTTGIDFGGEAEGFRSEWSGVSITNIPLGQGITVTLMQLLKAYATIANGGYAITPHLTARVGDGPVAVRRGPRVISAATARKVDRMLRDVVDVEGTGNRAAVRGYAVAGKTGTAQKIDPETGEYVSRYTASFVGYLPADRPELLIAVVVDEPGYPYYGGEVAAPAFEKIAEYSLQMLEIAP